MKILKKTKYTYLKRQAERNRNLCLGFFVIAAIAFLARNAIQETYSVAIMFGAMFIMVCFLGRWTSWTKGIAGEKSVSAVLQQMDDSFYLLDDINLHPRAGNIDHIVLGPNGIFVVETKNYTGTIQYAGADWYHSSHKRRRTRRTRISDPCKQVERNASMLASFLDRVSAGSISRVSVGQIHPVVGWRILG